MASIRASRLLRPGIALVALAALTLASASAAREQVVSARAVITGSGTSYRVTWNNTGDQAILCAGLLLTGVQPTSASGPAGVLTRVGTFQGRGLVHMQGNAATPVVPAGGTAAANFTTNVAIPANAGGEIRYSATCQPGSDVTGQATGPTPTDPPPPPPPPLPPCKCMNLDVTGVDADRLNGGLRLYVDWTMRCSRVPKGRCVGKLEVVPPNKKFAVQVFPKDGVVSCKGLCQRKPNKGRERIDLGFPGQDTDRGGFWRGQSFYIRFKTFCKSGSRFIPNGIQSATIAFDEKGALDVVQSDRNANGKPDGDEKRP